MVVKRTIKTPDKLAPKRAARRVNASKQEATTLVKKPRKPRKPRKQVNHVSFLLDGSGSMQGWLANAVVQAVNRLANGMAQLKDQQWLVSVYSFNDNRRAALARRGAVVNGVLNAHIVDWDVGLAPLPAINGYTQSGGTPLMDATAEVIAAESSRTFLNPDEDHAFLLYVLTDGEENTSRVQTVESLSTILNNLPDNWTVGIQVPNVGAVSQAKRFGFPVGNIETWTQDQAGVQRAEVVTRSSLEGYSIDRTRGFTQSKTLFRPDLSQVSGRALAASHPVVAGRLFQARRDESIRDLVESNTGRRYVKGSAFYELIKPEKIQSYKRVLVLNKSNGNLYEARDVLGLPAGDVRVAPGDHGNFRIFVQSTSVNRVIKADQTIVVTG